MSETVAKFGKWLYITPAGGLLKHATCGMCKNRMVLDGDHDKFCPECGAKMIKDKGYDWKEGLREKK